MKKPTTGYSVLRFILPCLLLLVFATKLSGLESVQAGPRSPANFESGSSAVVRFVATTGSDVAGDGSESNPFATFQHAIDLSLDGDEVHALPGTYTGPGNRDIDTQGKAIVIMSADNDPASCILDCQGSEADPHRAFYLTQGETRTTVLRGLTVRNGFAQSGGGIQVGDPDIWADETTATIENCVLESNQAVGVGGGVAIAPGSDPAVYDCLFLNNSAGSGGALGLPWENRIDALRCTFMGNTAVVDGGAIWARFEQPGTFVDCLFMDNSAANGGAYCNPLGESKAYRADDPKAYTAWHFINCDFLGNTAEYGGAYFGDFYVWLNFNGCRFEENVASVAGGAVWVYISANKFSSCLFDRNTAPTGGAMALVGNEVPMHTFGPEIIGSTFVFNAAETGSAIAYLQSRYWYFKIHNSIIAFGTGGAAISTDGATGSVMTCNDIFGNAGGDWNGIIAIQQGANGNISSDPQFCRVANSEFPYSLNATSPCAMEANPDCGIIGAFGVGCDYPVDVRDGDGYLPTAIRLLANHPNPFNPGTTIRFELSGAESVELTVFDVAGRLVKRLVSESLEAGPHEVAWAGEDDAGRPAASGVYFYCLEAGTHREMRRMVLVR